MPSDFRILGPQVKNGEEGRGIEGRRGRGREKGRNGEKRGLHTLTTFLTPTDPPLAPVLTEVANLGNWERVVLQGAHWPQRRPPARCVAHRPQLCRGSARTLRPLR